MADSEKLNRTSIPGKSRSSIPADAGVQSSENANTLLEWLGSFWTEVYRSPDFIKEIQSARAMRVAQLYLDLLENLKLEDRENAPVFHRERWHPIVIRKSWLNTGSKGMVKLTSETAVNSDGTVVPQVALGDQPSEVYRPCTTITLGGKDVNYNGMCVYPLNGMSDGLKSVLTCITNSITSASVVLGNGTDFAILDGAIAISERQDPFTGENADKFPKFDILGKPGEPDDVETVLWACDAMFDRDFIYRHLGYAMRLPSRSSEVYKQVVNAAWNATASGATPLLVTSLMAAICGIPTVKEEGEKVERVYKFVDGPIQVVTDKNVYDFPAGTELRKNVKTGAVLRRFDTLDKAIRVYACTTDARRLPLYNDFLDDFDEFTADVPAVDLPPAFFRSDIKKGFSVDWDLRDVIYVGNDKNGNPKLRFSIGGSKSDEDIFWNDTWKRYEDAGKSMTDCLEGIEYDTIYEVGAAWCQISPMEFFMHNLIGANTLIMTVRTDTLADDAPLYDPKFFGVLREAIPAYIRLYVVEHSSAPDEKYDTATGTYDEAELFVEDAHEEHVRFRQSGKRNGKGMSVRDRIDTKWVASCRDEYDDYE